MDFYAMHQSNHDGYQRWSRNIDDTKMKYMGDRNKARENAKLRAVKEGVSVKKDPPGKSPTAAAGGHGKRKGGISGYTAASSSSSSRQAEKPKVRSAWDDAVASAPKSNQTNSAWASKGYDQPRLSGGTAHRPIGTSPIHTVRPPAAPPRPTVRQVWNEGVADIQAQRITQHTEAAQASRARPTHTEGWSARTSQKLLSKADEIGAQRAASRAASASPTTPPAPATPTSSFSSGATSHAAAPTPYYAAGKSAFDGRPGGPKTDQGRSAFDGGHPSGSQNGRGRVAGSAAQTTLISESVTSHSAAPSATTSGRSSGVSSFKAPRAPKDPEGAAREIAMKFADHPGLESVEYGDSTLLNKSQTSGDSMRPHRVPDKRGALAPVTAAELSRRGKTAKAVNAITSPAERSAAFTSAVSSVVNAHPDVQFAEVGGKTVKGNRPK